MKAFIITAFLLLALPAALLGQAKSQIGFGTGWLHESLMDEWISADNSTGSSAPVIIFFRSNGENNRHHFQLLYSSVSLKSANLLVREQSGYVQYSFHRKFAESNGLKFFGGGLLNFNGSQGRYSEPGNLKSFQAAFESATSMTSLNPSLLVEKTMARDNLSIQIWSPVFGYMFGGMQYERGFISIKDYRGASVRISYCKYFSDRIEGRLEYQFQATTSTKFETITSGTQQLNFILVYNFH